MRLFFHFFLLIGFFALNNTFAQQNEYVDSLKNELVNCKTAEDSVNILTQITWRTSYSNSKDKLYYGQLALEAAARIDDPLQIAEAYDAAATGYKSVDSLKIAKSLFFKTLRIGQENNLPERIGFGSYHIAQLLISQDSLQEALKYLEISKEAFVKENRTDVLVKLGWLFIKTDRENQKEHIDGLITNINTIIEENEDPNSILFYYLDLSRLYNLLEDRRQSIYYVQLAMELAEKEKNNKGLAKSYYQIATYFRDHQQNYEASLIYLNKILEINQSNGKLIGVASMYNEIGYIHKLAGNDSLAIHYYNESLKISAEQKHRHTMADAFKNIGEIHYLSNNYKQALDYYKKCYVTGCDECPTIVFHSALINMGNVYLVSNDPDHALDYFQKAIALADSSNANYELAVSYFNLAKYFEYQNDISRSLAYNHRAFDFATKANSLQLQKDISEKLSQTYASQNNLTKAYQYLDISSSLQDSINNLNKAENLARLETRFEFQNLQMQKELAKAQADKEIAKQKMLRNFFFIGVILISIIGFFIHTSYRRKKKDNILLSQQKEAIKQMSEKVHEADQAKLQFFTNISHELRTPLTLIIGVTNKLKAIINDTEFIPVIRKNSFKLLQLINHLLDLRKLDTSNMGLKVSEGDLYDFVKGIANSFEALAKQKNIEIFFPDKQDITGYFDQNKLEKIISNLMSNALKYNKQNGEVKISFTSKENGFVEIEISDTGIGMHKNELENIFNRFYRVTENTLQGSGIGLALVKELIELHKGKISVESSKNKGSRFTVHLPVEKRFYTDSEIVANSTFELDLENYIEAVEIEQEISKEKLPTGTNNNKKSILVVEDNTDLRRFIVDIFKNDFTTIEAKDGEEGIKLSQKHVPDIIISDIMMPKISGIQLVEQVKMHKATSHIPVILLTAKNDIGTQLSSFEKGADDYIGKPFDSEILKSRVENLLRLRKQLVDKFSKQFHLQPKEIQIENADQLFLEKTINCIEKNISDPNLNIEFLAMELGVSRTQLYRKLKALTDYSANQFIRIIRLKRAAQILKHGQNNIAEVMDATGFSNYSYFNNCFKEYFGEYPKDYALLSVNGSLN